MTVATAVEIALEVECVDPRCSQFAHPVYEQMSSGRYDLCSVLDFPADGDMETWRSVHRTARKRSARAIRRGYRFEQIQRENHADAIHEINTSATVRQGRPMSNGYTTRQSFSHLPDYPCHRHAIRTYGILQGDTLVAYLWLYRAGQLALVSQILGHADHLENEVMYALVEGVLAAESMIDPDGFLLYNRHDSGTDGLRFFKERLGFEERLVQWLP